MQKLEPFWYTFKTQYAKDLFNSYEKVKGSCFIGFASRSKNLFVGERYGCDIAKTAIQEIASMYARLDDEFCVHETELENRTANIRLKNIRQNGTVVEVKILNPFVLRYFQFIERFDEMAFTWFGYIYNRPDQKTNMYRAFKALRRPLRHTFGIPFTYQLPPKLHNGETHEIFRT